MKIHQMVIETASTRSKDGEIRSFDRIRMVMYDLHFSCTIRDERDVRLAERLAKDAGVKLFDNRKK